MFFTIWVVWMRSTAATNQPIPYTQTKIKNKMTAPNGVFVTYVALYLPFPRAPLVFGST